MGKGIIMFLGLLLAGCAANNQMAQHGHAEAGDHQPEFARHMEGSTLQFTEKGMFGVELVLPDEELMVGTNELDLIVHDMEHQDIEGATVTVTPMMSGMGGTVLCPNPW